MKYGKPRYGSLDKSGSEAASSQPTYICAHCKKVKQFTSKTVTLTGHQDNNSLFLVTRLCEDCGKLLQDWIR